MNKNTVSLVIALVIVAVVAVLALTDVISLNGGGDTPADNTDNTSSEVVAVVNGEDITRDEFNTRFAQAEQNLIAQGQQAQLDDPAVRSQLETQILDQLIAEELVAQEIEDADVSVTAEEIDTQVEALVTQAGGQEAFNTQLEEAGLTEAELRANIENQLITQQYLLSVIDVDSIEVTDEEVEAAYEQIAANQENVPALDDQVREQLRAQLVQQEQNTLVNEFVSELRQEAEVETML